MSDPNGSSRTIKVVDRRKFTAEGEPIVDEVRAAERGGDDATGEAAPAPVELDAASGSEPHAADLHANDEPGASGANGAGSATSPEFLELIAVLAQQAEMLLAGAEEQGIAAQPEGARRMIDYLGALESKTAGNLSAEEGRALSSILYQLRTLFVQSRG